MSSSSTETDSDHPMEVEVIIDVEEGRPLSPVIVSIQSNHGINLPHEDRSRSPILTQHSTSSNSTLCGRQTPSSENNAPENCHDKPAVETMRDPECECRCKGKKTKTPSDDFDDDDGKLCPICFDAWTTSGAHRVCALRCGHLFGHSCLERWLQGQKNCPTCKRTVKKTDIRFIYAKKLIAVDTTELNILKVELDAEKIEKNMLQIELIQCKQREELSLREIGILKKQIETLKSTRVFNNSQSFAARNDWKIYKEKFFEISKDGGCRVMDYYKSSNILVVSAQSKSALFSGFGIRKVHVSDFKNSTYIPLHSSMIRDISFHPQKELLLSVSVDKCVRLTETANSKSVNTVNCPGPLWSCCWDVTNSNYFFVGEQSGTATKYDIRNLSEKLLSLQIPGDFSPVVSLASTGWCPGGSLPLGGVIVCKLNNCAVFAENHDESYTMYPLCLDGPFVSMRYDNITRHLLVTSRPNMRNPFSRHTLCTLVRDSSNMVVPSTVKVFQGAPVQKLLSRSCQMNVAGDVLVSAHQEANKVVDIWSVSSGKKISALPAHSPVLDLCPVFTDSAQYLCTLYEKKVDFFKLELS